MPLGCTDELVRPLIKNALALDELDDATRATTLHLDASSALAKVFVIVLTEDERRRSKELTDATEQGPPPARMELTVATPSDTAVGLEAAAHESNYLQERLVDAEEPAEVA